MRLWKNIKEDNVPKWVKNAAMNFYYRNHSKGITHRPVGLEKVFKGRSFLYKVTYNNPDGKELKLKFKKKLRRKK